MSVSRAGKVALAMVLAWVYVVAAADDEAIKKAMKRDEGTWKVISWTEDGKKIPEADLKDFRLVVKGNTWTLSKGKEFASSGTYKIVSMEKGVRKNEVKILKGTDAGKTRLELVKGDGDTGTICQAPEGKPRPTKFESKPGSGYRLTVWERVKK